MALPNLRLYGATSNADPARIPYSVWFFGLSLRSTATMVPFCKATPKTHFCVGYSAGLINCQETLQSVLYSLNPVFSMVFLITTNLLSVTTNSSYLHVTFPQTCQSLSLLSFLIFNSVCIRIWFSFIDFLWHSDVSSPLYTKLYCYAQAHSARA